jgi:hypothetical protein
MLAPEEDIERKNNKEPRQTHAALLLQKILINRERGFRKNQVDNKDQIPGIPGLQRKVKNHGPIRGKKIKEDVADKNRKADLIKAPEVRSFRNLHKNPAEEKGIKRNQQQGMGKVAVILKIKLPVKEAQNKVGVGEKTHGQACNGPPGSDLLIGNGLCNDRTG